MTQSFLPQLGTRLLIGDSGARYAAPPDAVKDRSKTTSNDLASEAKVVVEVEP